MIYTTIDKLPRYLGLSETLDTAIRHLLSCDLSALAMGRNEVDGDRVFINRFDYQTMPQEQAIWEGHIAYGDMHVLLSGQEKIGVTDAASLRTTVCRSEEDFVGYEGPVRSWCSMTPREVLIVFPEDVHMVKVMDGESVHCQKACFKFKV